MVRIALTGNIGAGKSTVAALFHSWGATIIDADLLTREVQKAGTPTLAAMAERFGPGILNKNGSLNRARLRDIVLADAAARHDLEGLVHPGVQQLRLTREAAAQKRGVKILIHEIPLLFEALEPADFDRVVLVDAPDPVRLIRIVSSRNLPESQAAALIAAQMPAAIKRAWRGGDPPRGPLIIDNDGSTAELEVRARKVWEEISH